MTELYTKGQVETLTPRRRGKDGKLARVRSKRGSSEKSVRPTDTRGKRAPSQPRGRFSHQIRHMPEGGRLHDVELPKTKGSKGRNKGLEAIRDSMYRITSAGSQRHTDKRVRMTVTYQDANGSRYQVPLGSKSGYHASDVLADIRTKHAGSVESWITSQAQAVYQDMGKDPLVGVQMNEHTATRTKTERRAQDAAGTRRGKSWKR